MVFNNSIAFLGFLYFLQGLPYGLQSRFLPLYFRTHGMSLSSIGFFKILLVPWMLKALWAPLVDIHGTKRQWLSYSMMGLFITCLIGSLSTPELVLQLGIVLLFFNILTSTQDIAVDGLAIQILLTSELAAGNIAQVVGYKLGAVFSGGFLIWISETFHVTWSSIFVILSLAYLTAYFIVLKKVPASQKGVSRDETIPDGTKSCEPKTVSGHDSDFIRHGFLQHFTQILSTSETKWVLLYVLIYKLGEQGALTMLPLYLVDRNISSASVGFWTGIIGQSASIFGSVFGGWLVTKFRLSPYQIIQFFSYLRMLSLLLYPFYIVFWTNQLESTLYGFVVTTILVMLTGSGIITTTTFTLMMYCSQRAPESVQASHYTTLATIEVLGKLTFSVLIGSLTDLVGYTLVFSLFCVLGLCVIPVLSYCPSSLREMNHSENKNS